MRKGLLAIMASAVTQCAFAAVAFFGHAERVPQVNAKAQSLVIEGTTLYCGAGDELVVLDVADALRPKLLTKVPGFGHLRQLAADKGWVAVSSRSAGAWLVDAREPAKARIACHYDTVEQATGIELAGDMMFVGQRGTGVEFVDISDRTRPEHIRMVKTPESQSVMYDDGYLYSGDWHVGNTTIIEMCDPAEARVVAVTQLQGYGDGFDLDDRLIFASTGHHRMGGMRKNSPRRENIGKGHGMEIWDRSDLLHPRFVARVEFPELWRIHNDMWMTRESAGWAFCADTYNGLFAVDVREPDKAKIVDRFCVKNPDDPEAPSYSVTSVAVGSGAVYATTLGAGLWVIPCPVAKPRLRDRGKAPARRAWRDGYATHSERFESWQPPRRGQVHSVAAYRGIHYVGCSSSGCYVVGPDFNTAGTIPCAYARDVVVRGDRLYVAQGDDGLGVYSLDDPLSPREIARIRQFASGVTRCEWVYVPSDRWAVCADRRHSYWQLMDISDLGKPRCALRAPNLNWVRPMTESLLDGKWLGYAHTHSFVKWYDLSGKDPIVVDTEDKTQTGPLRRRTNFLYGRAGCCVFRGGMLVVNDGSFILLAAGQDRNADGSPWKALAYANSATVRPRGAPAWNGADRVMLASADLREIQLVDFGEPDCPKLLWQEKTAGFPGCPLFHQGRFLVPCGYQGLLRERSERSGDLISATDK